MSDFKLNTFVHAVEFDANGARTGRERVFGPEDDLSARDNEWALSAITNKDVWADNRVPARKAPPAPAQDDEVARLKARIAELEQIQAETGDTSESKVPPRQGPGSGADKWRAYAKSVEVQVGDDASRDDVIAALEAAGKPTK
jgi:hypothetical protein